MSPVWQPIPDSYKHGISFNDFWEGYQTVFPVNQPQAVGKEIGQTAHVERWDNTVHQRLAGFVRKTLCSPNPMPFTIGNAALNRGEENLDRIYKMIRISIYIIIKILLILSIF